MRVRRQPKPPVTRERCEVCWTKYGRDLWKSSCLCIPGAIQVPFQPPGILRFNPDPATFPKDPPKKTKSKKDKRLAS